MIKPGMFINDRYEIVDKVGSGGMADVYKARCHRLNRFVAIKVLKPEYSGDESFVTKFRAEAQSAAGLSHPNIVNVYDVGDDEGLHYIVMELVEGITLKSFIERKGRLAVKEAIGIAIQIGQGLEAAHNNHIVHRDIKPQNIIISREGKVKVTDFGIAKAVTSNTITSNAMGSVHYISPEQARGGYSDERSDLYSLGITMYEMLTGKVPFGGDNTVSVALLHIQGEATPIRELEPDIPVSVDKIVQKCMQKKPERRYLSAAELIADLKKALANPEGEFVKIVPTVVDDSPTINLSDEEVEEIKSGTKRTYTPTDENKVRNKDKKSEKKKEDDDKEDSEVDPKLEKAMVIGSIVAGVILLLVLVFVVGKLFGLFPSGKKKIEPSATPIESIMPIESAIPNGEEIVVLSVVGKDGNEAKKLLEELGLYVTTTFEPNANVEQNNVFEQSIEGGTKAKTGDSIMLKISSGKEQATMPDVSKNTETEATKILTSLGLKVTPKYEWDDNVQKDWVVGTKPAAGSTITDGEQVTLIISRGKEETEVTVPNLEGLTEKGAASALEEKGLVLGRVTKKYSNNVAKGNVITAEYSPSQSVAKGTKVGITVSLGADPKENVSYEFTATVNDNPFEEGGEGNVVVSLTQDGKTTNIYDEWVTYDDFPLPISAKSKSGSSGKVIVYVDGTEISRFSVSFSEVAN